LQWYARRLERMSPSEVVWRVEDRLRQEAWARRQFGPPTAPALSNGSGPFRPAQREARAPATQRATPRPSAGDLSALPAAARQRLLSAAEKILEGRWEFFGHVRHDMADPDWSLDPVSGGSYPSDRTTFRIDYRSEDDQRRVKQVWELSRHHHLTVLACAWRLTGDERYATLVDGQLRAWWRKNPVLTGINWSSGIELGIRMISWVWVRRLLDGWSGAPALFEDNAAAVHQIYWHQRFLDAFPSRGSSANNHAIAEAAGLLVGSCAFPWFAESDRWREQSAQLLEDELARNTFASGLNQEQAFEYHGLVLELGLTAACEAEAAGARLRDSTWELLGRMLDTLAAVLDAAGRPPRYGDGDDGRALLLAAPDDDRWSSLLALGRALVGPQSWWPPTTPDAQSILLSGLVDRTFALEHRMATRQSHFPDAGLTILRTPSDGGAELWCRCDGGPHGFLSIAAHAHADALSVEVRSDGVELLADPGTYCYHGEPAWRRYFRSTLAHNTLELDHQDQSTSGGPFLWMHQPRTRLRGLKVDGPGLQYWSAEHDGYGRLDMAAHHHRCVTLDPTTRSLEIVDRVESVGTHALRLAFHLGPTVEAVLREDHATLRWARPQGGQAMATLLLPPQLSWRAYRGATDPIVGWYSSGFGRREPTTTLVGSGRMAQADLRSWLQLRT
jgi:Heparinase II/III-like protein/Heparinase II/III N-terminus